MKTRINKAAIYCPVNDKSLLTDMKGFCYYWRNAFTKPFLPGQGDLGTLDARAPLYLFMHGHASVPLFTSKVGSLSADQVAAQMVKDGLNTDHLDLHLLVCNAGASVTSWSEAKRRLALRDKALAAKKIGDEKAFARFSKQFAQRSNKGPGIGPYTFGRKQTYPLAALLMGAMKRRGFTRLRIISYAAPVVPNFDKREVLLDLTGMLPGDHYGDKASAHPHLKKVWH